MLLKTIKTRSTPSALFRAIKHKYRNSFLLESAAGPDRLVRYSFIGFAPEATVRIKDGSATISSADSAERKIVALGAEGANALEFLREVLGAYTQYDSFDGAIASQIQALQYVGGLVGYVSYDFVRNLETLASETNDELRMPDAMFGVYYDGVIYDHLHGAVLYFSRKEDRSAELLPLFSSSEAHQRKGALPHELSLGQLTCTPDRTTFETMVQKAKKYVYDGDVLQVVISKRFEAPYSGDFDSFYERLKKTNPSPYMYYLDFDDTIIVGSSPEMLVRTMGRNIEMFPIAGTRPIVADEKQNKSYRRELLSDKKEKAEHVMLVDLARNDLGKICKPGSIEIPDYMVVERYSHVQHIVSRITGIAAEGYDAFDALAAVFPAGTVSGAPKVRAMEIIEELENVRRGPYAGAVGYFSFNGNMDLAITIRTLFANKNKLVVQSGAGIVADSTPEKEWEETENKARALLAILEEAHENGGDS